MSRFSVHAIGASGYGSGVVAVLNTQSEADRVAELLNGYVHYDFRVAPESISDTYLREVTLLESVCYYAWEFPSYLSVDVTDADRTYWVELATLWLLLVRLGEKRLRSKCLPG